MGLGWVFAGSVFPETILGGSVFGDQVLGAGGGEQRFVEGLGQEAVGASSIGSWVGGAAAGGSVLEVGEGVLWFAGGFAPRPDVD